VIVGVVSPEDANGGPVACPNPGCGQLFCAECGTPEHGNRPCPAPREMEAFLAKHAKNTKRCPNCSMGVTKVYSKSWGNPWPLLPHLFGMRAHPVDA